MHRRHLLGYIAHNFQFDSPVATGQNLLHTASLAIRNEVLCTVHTFEYREVLEDDEGVFAHFKWQIAHC